VQFRFGHRHPQGEHPHHPRHLLERFEGYTDLLVVALVVVLAAAMVYGLMTAGSGAPSWWTPD